MAWRTADVFKGESPRRSLSSRSSWRRAKLSHACGRQGRHYDLPSEFVKRIARADELCLGSAEDAMLELEPNPKESPKGLTRSCTGLPGHAGRFAPATSRYARLALIIAKPNFTIYASGNPSCAAMNV